MDPLPHTGDACMEDNIVAVLTDQQNLRKEHTEASQDTKATLSRVESSLADVFKWTMR